MQVTQGGAAANWVSGWREARSGIRSPESRARNSDEHFRKESTFPAFSFANNVILLSISNLRNPSRGVAI